MVCKQKKKITMKRNITKMQQKQNKEPKRIGRLK